MEAWKQSTPGSQTRISLQQPQRCICQTLLVQLARQQYGHGSGNPAKHFHLFCQDHISNCSDGAEWHLHKIVVADSKGPRRRFLAGLQASAQTVTLVQILKLFQSPCQPLPAIEDTYAHSSMGTSTRRLKRAASLP